MRSESVARLTSADAGGRPALRHGGGAVRTPRPLRPPPCTAPRGAVPRELAVQLLTSLPLAYICVATYFALFRVNAFDYNKLFPRWAYAGARGVEGGGVAGGRGGPDGEPRGRDCRGHPRECVPAR